MIQGFNPRTGRPAGQPVAETTAARVGELVARAAAAFPRWAGSAVSTSANVPVAVAGERRAAALDAIADALDEETNGLVALADEETALGGERLTGEVARTTGQLRLFAAVVRDCGYADPVLSPATGAAPDLRRINQARGPVAVFASSNFPFAFSVAGGDTASALAAGCPVLVKAHEGHPRTSERTAAIVAEALQRTGAPDGTFALIHGVEAGLALLRHPSVAAAGFTGSTAAGLFLAGKCAARAVPIPFFGELGSVNPVVVLPAAASARAALVAAGYAGSLTLGAGQFCTNPGLLFVPDDPVLRAAIVAEVTASRGGPMLTAKIFAGYQAAVAEAGAQAGVEPLAAGQPGEGPWGATPQVFGTGLEEFAAADVLVKERFGPAGLVISYPSVDELLPVLAALTGNLVGTVHADPADYPAARRVIGVLERVAGRIVVNGWPTGVAVVAAQHHGGPWPATTAAGYTSVGTAAIRRWLVPVAYQGFPAELLPDQLRLPA